MNMNYNDGGDQYSPPRTLESESTHTGREEIR